MARARTHGGWRHLPAALIAAGFLLPIVYMITGSLRTPGTSPPRTAELVPWPPTTAAYERAFELVDLGRYVVNSIAVAAVTVPLTLLVASWAGFAMTRPAPRTARALIAVSLVALMVPLTALLVPRFILFRELGLIDTLRLRIGGGADDVRGHRRRRRLPVPRRPPLAAGLA